MRRVGRRWGRSGRTRKEVRKEKGGKIGERETKVENNKRLGEEETKSK